MKVEILYQSKGPVYDEILTAVFTVDDSFGLTAEGIMNRLENGEHLYHIWESGEMIEFNRENVLSIKTTADSNN